LLARTMHEVGHALGLTHNFRASTVYTQAQLNDLEFTRKNGVTGSVMEYTPINLALRGEFRDALMVEQRAISDTWGFKQNVSVSLEILNGAVGPGGANGVMTFSLNLGTPNDPAATPITLGLRDGLTGDYGNGSYDPLTGVYTPKQTIYTDFADGYAEGTLTGLSFNQTGGVDARFDNGQVVEIAKLAMSKFANQDGLEKVGGNYFRATANSGLAQIGVAGSAGFGLVSGGSLEASNVDLTVELTNMILAQRMFESNARVVTAADRVLDTLVNLGR